MKPTCSRCGEFHSWVAGGWSRSAKVGKVTQSQILVVVSGDTPLPLPADVRDIHLRFDDNIRKRCSVQPSMIC